MDNPRTRLVQLPLRATPELVEKLEPLPDYFEAYDPEDLADLLAQIKEGDYDFCAEPDAFTQVIDPDTGDSLLQIAIRQGSLEGVEKILSRFQRSRGPFALWARHALFVHRNKAGNNSLHEAAKRGILHLLIMVYRAIDDHWSWTIPSEDFEDAAEKDVYHVDTEDESSSARLLMLLATNSQGRTPASEARAAGNDVLAQLLDDIVERLDPEGVRRSETGKAEMLEMVRSLYRYDIVQTQ